MAELPFQIFIKRSFPEEQTEILTCTVILRVIPGVRQVYDASWGGRSVIAKIFSHKISAKRHFIREWKGLSLLQKRGLSSPEPLFWGKTEDGRWAVVVEKIENSTVVLDLFNKTIDLDGKLDLLFMVCREMARQHVKGVLQNDLHLGNFLLRENKVFAIDPGQMKFFSSPIPWKRCISQLAALACYLSFDDSESIKKLCQVYADTRKRQFSDSDSELFQKQLKKQKERGISKGLKKYLRTSRRTWRIKTGRYVGMFLRDFCNSKKALEFIEQIDALMDGGDILKRGNTCYVSRIAWNNADIVVKRYNNKGFIHSLRHTLKRSRACRGWLHAHRLGMLEIPTAKPLAYIERRRGPIVWTSYLVTEHVKGQMLHDFMNDSDITEEQRSEKIKQVVKMLDRLGKHHISHGDLKHSNILLTDNGPVLIDLDAMIVHKWHWTFQPNRAKDIERFTDGYMSY